MEITPKKFDPTDDQIRQFLDVCIEHYDMKSIERDPYGNGPEIEVEIVTSWHTVSSDDEDDEPFDVEDLLTFYPNRIDFGNFPAGGAADDRLYNKWLLANGFHEDLMDNPFLEDSRKVANAPKREGDTEDKA